MPKKVSQVYTEEFTVILIGLKLPLSNVAMAMELFLRYHNILINTRIHRNGLLQGYRPEL